MTVPMHNLEGVRNMYREAYEHSRDLDYIALPMAGMSHPVLKGKSELSAEIATSEFKKFSNENPSSNLKVILLFLMIFLQKICIGTRPLLYKLFVVVCYFLKFIFFKV